PRPPASSSARCCWHSKSKKALLAGELSPKGTEGWGQPPSGFAALTHLPQRGRQSPLGGRMRVGNVASPRRGGGPKGRRGDGGARRSDPRAPSGFSALTHLPPKGEAKPSWRKNAVGKCRL